MTVQHRIGRLVAVVFSGLLLLGLGGCNGSSGSAGAEGPPGSSGPPAFGASPTALQITIDRVTVSDGRPVVEFRALDQDGYAFSGLPSANFTIAKLVPGSEGATDNWQAYVNRVETPTTGGPGGTPVLASALQATSENNVSGATRGTLVNHENGRYTYTFGNNLASVTNPLTSQPIGYEPNLTHRVGLQVTGSYRGATLPHANTTYTFVPASGMQEGISDRRIVETETCNSCHGQLVVHGNPGRVDTAYCVTCHNPGTTDANSGENLDFAVMVHKIHRGVELPSVVGGFEYAIWGFGNSKHDYSTVKFPQDVRNCTTCHDPANAATPQAVLTTTYATIETCGSCHDDVVFDGSALEHWQKAHAQPTENAECSTCHRPGGIGGDIVASHVMPGKVVAQRMQYNILGLDTSDPAAPQVDFSVTDDGVPITLPGVFAGGAITVRLNWARNGVLDYASDGGISVNALTPGAGTSLSGPVGGVYTATFNAAANPVPADASKVVAGIEGSGRTAEDDRIPLSSAAAFFNADGSDAASRRQVVTLETCAGCHNTNEVRAYHGGNRNDQPQYCVMCHNGTRVHASRGGNDLKYLIHTVHSGNISIGAWERTARFMDVEYPRSSSDCTACHQGNSFQLPLAAGIPVTGLRIVDAEERVVTPTAASCMGCHDGGIAQAHMEQNGAQIDRPLVEVADTTTRLPLPGVVETCVVCHGPDQVADIRTVHGLN